jgi:hypothetical protein
MYTHTHTHTGFSAAIISGIHCESGNIPLVDKDYRTISTLLGFYISAHWLAYVSAPFTNFTNLPNRCS